MSPVQAARQAYASAATAFVLGVGLTCCVWRGTEDAKPAAAVEPEFVALGETVYSDSVPVKFLSNHDGDTLTVDVPGWPDVVGKKITVRVAGIDTPEMTDKRPDVKEKAECAKLLVADRLRKATVVELRGVRRDKYFRLLADVSYYPTARGKARNLADDLTRAGLAKPYDGGTKEQW